MTGRERLCWLVIHSVTHIISKKKILFYPTSCLLVSPADIIGFRGQTKCWSWSGSKMFDSLMVSLKFYSGEINRRQMHRKQAGNHFRLEWVCSILQTSLFSILKIPIGHSHVVDFGVFFVGFFCGVFLWVFFFFFFFCCCFVFCHLMCVCFYYYFLFSCWKKTLVFWRNKRLLTYCVCSKHCYMFYAE